MGSDAPFILASASPRRRELLLEAGYRFDVAPADVDEDGLAQGRGPVAAAELLARAKAQAVGARYPQRLVLGSDTVVALGEVSVGKPANPAEARAMLRLLEGTTHIVISAVCLYRASPEVLAVDRAMSAVRMRRLSESEIERYVAGGQWQGKAGGYGIQDNDPFVMALSGSWSNIVGLPMELTRRMLSAVGVEPSD